MKPNSRCRAGPPVARRKPVGRRSLPTPSSSEGCDPTVCDSQHALVVARQFHRLFESTWRSISLFHSTSLEIGMRRLARFLQPLLLVGVAVLFSPAIAAAPLSFQATINFSEQVSITGSTPCFGTGAINGVGVAAKVGAITVTSTDCINPLPTGTSFGFASQNVVLTAANGDQLYATYMGILSP